jgi:uncharacterized protein (TIGR03067 family)
VRRHLILALLPLVLVGFAPAPFPRPERRRAESQGDLNGTWRFVLWELKGEREEGIEKEFQVEVARDKFVIVGRTSSHREEYDVHVDPAAKPPYFSLSRGGALRCVGSYRLQKDHVRVILNRSDQKDKRPTDFAGSSDMRFEMRRTKR